MKTFKNSLLSRGGFAATLVFILLFYIGIFNKDKIIINVTDQQTAVHWKTQRNDLSKLLNDLRRKYGQQSCQLQSKSSLKVSEFGGWCRAVSLPGSKEHVTDKIFLQGLSTFLANKTVGSFGDGPGHYKAGMEALGDVRSYTAYDGAPFVEEVTDGKVNFMDLSAPQYGYPIFDWVLSFEVGEHIPAQFEDIFLDNVVRHAREGVVLSWATIGQRGYSHVNNKNLSSVVMQMERRGFSLNDVISNYMMNQASVQWLRENVRVYVRAIPGSLDVNDA